MHSMRCVKPAAVVCAGSMRLTGRHWSAAAWSRSMCGRYRADTATATPKPGNSGRTLDVQSGVRRQNVGGRLIVGADPAPSVVDVVGAPVLLAQFGAPIERLAEGGGK
jgi:hypothetical protein